MTNKLDEIYGKSLQLAAQIEIIKPVLIDMDLEHLQHCIKTFTEQASFQDRAAVLNPNYNPVKSDVIRAQAKTMKHLLDFVNGLAECDELKKKASLHDANREKINELFW